MLSLALGRRIHELLTAPRGVNSDGPLSRHPARGSSTKGALWFQFHPNKEGPNNQVYISPKWEDIVQYCTRELLRYSDEVRNAASPQECELLILISKWNQTSGSKAAVMDPDKNLADFTHKRARSASHTPLRRRVQKRATALSYPAFTGWLHGRLLPGSSKRSPGILYQWNVTIDGKVDGQIYWLRTHQTRHTRQSAIARDPQVSRLSLQRDLNHNSRDMQLAYQHGLREQNEAFLAKAQEGQLAGPSMVYLSTIFNIKDGKAPQSLFQAGQPPLLSPHLRKLIMNNPQFFQFNRVPCGLCTLPQGPGGCEEFMNCTEAEEGGCRWFVTDPEDEQMQIELDQRVNNHRQKEQVSSAAGRTVQAGKYKVMAERTEALREDVRMHTSQEMLGRLQARKREIEESEE